MSIREKPGLSRVFFREKSMERFAQALTRISSGSRST
jgi:hypothetical protein